MEDNKTGRFVEVRSFDEKTGTFFGAYGKPLCESQFDELVRISYAPTHRIEWNYYFDEEEYDSCADRWWTISL